MQQLSNKMAEPLLQPLSSFHYQVLPVMEGHDSDCLKTMDVKIPANLGSQTLEDQIVLFKAEIHRMQKETNDLKNELAEAKGSKLTTH